MMTSTIPLLHSRQASEARWWRLCLLIIVLMLVRIPVALAAPSSIQLGEVSDSHTVLPTQARYWVETEALTAENVASLPNAAWQRLDGASLAVRVWDEPVWFQLVLENETEQALTRLIEVRWKNLRELDFYQFAADGAELSAQSAGLERPLNAVERQLAWLDQVTLAPGEQRTMLIRVRSDFTLFLPTFIWEPTAYTKAKQERLYWYCLAIGALLALSLYNLSLYAFTRDRSYLIYSAYVCAATAYELGVSGIGHYILWGESPWWRIHAFYLSIYFTFFLSGLFIRQFLQLGERQDWVRPIANFCIGFWGVGLIIHIFTGGWVSGGAIEVAGILSCMVALTVSIKLWREGDVSARYFTIAWTALLLLTILTMLMMQGLAPYNFLTENGQLIGFVVEMLLLSFALAERINRERLQREAAQRRVLDMQLLVNEERSKKLDAQSRILALQQHTNAELEARVSERTETLQRTLQDLADANRELARISVIDPLTQISNRRYFDEVLAAELERSRNIGRPTALILIDIDHFKQFNDRYGHLVGDDCLRLVAKTLQQTLTRSSDLVARYGGEEFGVIMGGVELSQAAALAEDLRVAVENLRFIYHGQHIPISISLGVAQSVLPQDSTQALIKRADEALYDAKRAGRNCARSA